VPFRWIDHTGELELELEAESEHGLFEAAFEAMCELLSGSATAERVEVEVELEAPDHALLLADWLGELAFLGETRGLVPDRLASFELDARSARGRVEGAAGDPPHLVKGVTYHRLALSQADGGWRARVVLDV
jgi:SHS2 domain-containing protein